MFIKDTSGNKSLTATFAVISFVVVMLKVIFSGAEVSVASFSYNFGAIDAGVIAAIFAPIMGTYTVRRWGSPANQQQDTSADSGGKPGDGAA